MIPNLYLGNGCFTKHPLKIGCLRFQVYIYILTYSSFMGSSSPSLLVFHHLSVNGCHWLQLLGFLAYPSNSQPIPEILTLGYIDIFTTAKTHKVPFRQVVFIFSFSFPAIWGPQFAFFSQFLCWLSGDCLCIDACINTAAQNIYVFARSIYTWNVCTSKKDVT